MICIYLVRIVFYKVESCYCGRWWGEQWVDRRTATQNLDPTYRQQVACKPVDPSDVDGIERGVGATY
jgi:hypothetical protein